MFDMKIELAASAAGVGLIFLSTISSLSILLSSLLKARKHGLPQVYADKDGISTEELTAKFNTKIAKIAIWLLSLGGFSAATSLAVLGTLGRTDDNLFIEDWLNAGSWVCFSLHLRERGALLTAITVPTCFASGGDRALEVSCPNIRAWHLRRGIMLCSSRCSLSARY
jgi:hypothetical protein